MKSAPAHFAAALALLLAAWSQAAFPDPETEAGVDAMPPASPPSQAPVGQRAASDYPSDTSQARDRISYRITRAQRGTTLKIPESAVSKLCSDVDGCELRLGMYNWDNSGRVASRSSLFHYNDVSHTWRAEAGDPYGTDYNGVTEHIMHAWACYFTDGEYSNWNNLGDPALDFGLLSWNQYNADCWLTIID